MKTASLRFVSKMIKTTRTTGFYKLGADVASKPDFATMTTAISAALATAPLGQVSAEGNSGKQVSTDNNIADKYQTVASWTNTIELDASKISVGEDLNLLVAITGDRATNTNTNRFFGKNAEGFTNPNYSALTATSDDLVPQLTLTYEEDTDNSTVVKTPLVDTYLRKGNTVDHGSETTMELKTYADGDADFVGYMSFEYSVPTGMELQSAKLRVVSAQIKGDRTLNFYSFAADVPSAAKYADYADAIATAKGTTAVGTVELEGQSGKSVMSDDVTTEKYQTITAWQNTVDLTDFVKTQTGNFGLLLVRDDANNSNKIFSADATGISNSNCNYFNSCTANDLIPQLTLVFKKSGSTPTPTPTPVLTGEYAINIDQPDHATITSSHASADANTEVTLTVTPENASYKVVKLTIEQETDDESDTGVLSARRKSSTNSLIFAPNISVTKESETVFKFTMPANAVRVSAVLTDKPVAKPVISYDEDNNKVTISLGAADDTYAANSVIYYTTDGTDPTTASASSSSAVNIDVTDGMTVVKAFGCDESGNASQIVSQNVSRVHYLTVSKQWVAFCSPNTYAVPEGLEAYVITSVTQPDNDGENGTVVLSAAQSVIEKDKAMIIKNTKIETDATATKFKLTASTGTVSATPCAEFKGATTATTLNSSNTNYVLKDGMFVRTTRTSISQYNCYLEFSAAGVRGFTFTFGEENTTSIQPIGSAMLNDGHWYNLQGTRMAEPTQKGIYIHNGKKVVVK